MSTTMVQPLQELGYPSSDGRHSFEPLTASTSMSKTQELARAIRREHDGPVRSFRPPSGWSQRTGHANVVWSGDYRSSAVVVQEDQFSDQESWDGDADDDGTHAALVGDHESVHNHYGNNPRPFSIGSSIFAGRGVRADKRRKEVVPPLPLLPIQHINATDRTNLSSKTFPFHGLSSPVTEFNGFETSSQYSANEDRDEPKHDLPSPADFAKEAESWSPSGPALAGLVPSRGSSRNLLGKNEDEFDATQDTEHGPLPGSVSRTKSFERGLSSQQPAIASMSPSSQINRPRLPDGMIIPKMPPIPKHGGRPERARRHKPQRPASPELLADEDEEKFDATDDPEDDVRRMSSLGPKLKKNAPAPWELGGEDISSSSSLPRPSLKDTFRPSVEGFEKSFSRFKSRPSAEVTASCTSNFSQAIQPSRGPGSTAVALDSEAVREDDVPTGRLSMYSSSIFSQQRSRSKSVSSSAAGVLKGLGLANSAGPASKKSKLVKAFRRGGDDGKKSTLSPSSDHTPLSASNTMASPRRTQLAQYPGSAALEDENGSISTPSKKVIGNSPLANAVDLAEILMNANGRYKNQVCSPPMASQPANYASSTSPRLGGTRKLPYKKSGVISRSGSEGGAIQMAGGKEAGFSTSSRSVSARESSGRSSNESGQNSGADRNSLYQKESHLHQQPPQHHQLNRQPIEPRPNSAGTITNSGALDRSPSLGSGRPMGVPMLGGIESVPYKLISLEEAREQAKMRQAQERLLSTSSPNSYMDHPHPHHGPVKIRGSPSQLSFHSHLDDRSPNAEPQEFLPTSKSLKSKKSGFLRMLKKDKGNHSAVADADTMSVMTSSASFKHVYNDSPSIKMPSFYVTGSENGTGENKLGLTETPALSLRPVSSMFSGLGTEFLDPSVAESHLGQASIGSNGSPMAGSTLLVPHSPAMTFCSQESNRSSISAAFEDAQEVIRNPLTASPSSLLGSEGVAGRPRIAHIKATPHSMASPGPPHVSGSVDSFTALTASRLPSLESNTSSNTASESQSQLQSPATSPTAQTFGREDLLQVKPSSPAAVQSSASMSIDSVISGTGTGAGIGAGTSCDSSLLLVPSSPSTQALVGRVSAEVRQRAVELEEQIKQLAQELQELRTKHMGPYGGSMSRGVSLVIDDPTGFAIPDCPCCGCGCSEERKLQALNEAAVLKGVSILDRGRALKPSSNVGSTGRFGGYLDR